MRQRSTIYYHLDATTQTISDIRLNSILMREWVGLTLPEFMKQLHGEGWQKIAETSQFCGQIMLEREPHEVEADKN